MDIQTANALLKSLLERLDADSRSENARMTGFVSASERQAIEAAIRQISETASRDRNQDTPSDTSETLESKPGALHHTHPSINELAFSFSTVSDTDFVLCLDFGTAKSKAFAASQNEGKTELLELPLGKRDGDLEGAIYAVNSSVWIEDDGSMFAGSQAVQRGAKWATGGTRDRARLDSLKQEISQALTGHQGSSQQLPENINPSGVKLSYDDAITFYLAYLTDMAVSELEERYGKSRYMKRRFALPCWEPSQRIRAAEFLSKRLACAQVLADTFHGLWKDGIPAADFKRALELTLPRVDRLTYLLDMAPSTSAGLSRSWGGLLEPLAAGASRIWMDREARELVMVLDVGAGTTDLSLFLVVQNSDNVSHKAFPVAPGGDAIRMAGDQLDSVLLSQILGHAKLGADPTLIRRVSSALRLGGIRRLKEQLFNTGELTHTLVNDQVVRLTLEEFLATEEVRNFTAHLESAIERFFAGVDDSWQIPMANIKVVLTGGGCDLPMVTTLAEKVWLINGHTIRLSRMNKLPDLIIENYGDDFAKEYPQLAVALGGALPTILDEGGTQLKWGGITPRPGPVTRYQVSGT